MLDMARDPRYDERCSRIDDELRQNEPWRDRPPLWVPIYVVLIGVMLVTVLYLYYR